MLPDYRSESTPETTHRNGAKTGLGPSELFSALSTSVWNESKKRAESAYQSFGKIDSLRPYFDVEPKEVLGRILSSIDPRPPYNHEYVTNELYGPFMACLTLIAVILFEMKLSDHQVQEGTLMGSAIVSCFGYWVMSSGIIFAISFSGESRLTFVQILSAVGYAMCSTCLVLFVCAAIHTGSSEILFFLSWILCCGMSATKLALIIWTNVSKKSSRVAGAIVSVSLHMVFVVYLHLAYHSVVQDVSDAIGSASTFDLGT